MNKNTSHFLTNKWPSAIKVTYYKNLIHHCPVSAFVLQILIFDPFHNMFTALLLLVVEHFLSYRKVWKLQQKSQRHFTRRFANTVIWHSFLLPMLELEMFWRSFIFYLLLIWLERKKRKEEEQENWCLTFLCLFLGPKSSWMLRPASWEGRYPSGACCDWNCPCGYGWRARPWYGYPVIGASIAVWGAKYPTSSATGPRSSLYFQPKGDECM